MGIGSWKVVRKENCLVHGTIACFKWEDKNTVTEWGEDKGRRERGQALKVWKYSKKWGKDMTNNENRKNRLRIWAKEG